MNMKSIHLAVLLLLLLSLGIQSAGAINLTIQNNTDFTLTRGEKGYGPNTNAYRIWIEWFLSEVTVKNTDFMSLNVQPGAGPALGCVFFIYQVTDSAGNAHGRVGGTYCPYNLALLKTWSTSPDVKIEYAKEAGEDTFTVNPKR